MVEGDVRFELGDEMLIENGDRAQQTRPVALAGQFDGRARAARKSWGMRPDVCEFLGLVDTDSCGVHPPPLFQLDGTLLARFRQLKRLSGAIFDNTIRLFQQPPTVRIGVLDTVGFFEILLDERRRVDTDFLGRFVNSSSNYYYTNMIIFIFHSSYIIN